MPRPTSRYYFGCVALIAGCAVSGSESPLPRTIQLGSTVESLRPLLAEDCSQTEELHYTGEMAAPFGEQTQVNCTGLDIFGARRRAEFMFNDGPLGHVWIFIQADETVEIRRNLVESFGQVAYETPDYAVFASGTVALRQDPREVLVATPKLIAELTGYPGARGQK